MQLVTHLARGVSVTVLSISKDSVWKKLTFHIWPVVVLKDYFYVYYCLVVVEKKGGSTTKTPLATL